MSVKSRPVLPNVNGSGRENTEVSKYLSKCSTTEPESFTLSWSLFGRKYPLPAWVVFEADGRSGHPVLMVMMPLSCHPPSTASATGFQPAP